MVRIEIRNLPEGLSLAVTAVTTSDIWHIYYLDLLYKCVGVNCINRYERYFSNRVLDIKYYFYNKYIFI